MKSANPNCKEINENCWGDASDDIYQTLSIKHGTWDYNINTLHVFPLSKPVPPKLENKLKGILDRWNKEWE